MTQVTSEEKKTARKSPPKKKPVTAQASVAKLPEQAQVEAVSEETAAAQKELRPEDFVTVRNGFNGKLVYRSRSTKELFIWDGLGAEQDMELRELKHARNSARAYFENNWFLFDNPAVPQWLGVDRYYTGALSVDEVDALFEKKPEEIENTLFLMPSGQKEMVASRAKDLIRTGEKIDSLKVIAALERGLGVTLRAASVAE